MIAAAFLASLALETAPAFTDWFDEPRHRAVAEAVRCHVTRAQLATHDPRTVAVQHLEAVRNAVASASLSTELLWPTNVLPPEAVAAVGSEGIEAYKDAYWDQIETEALATTITRDAQCVRTYGPPTPASSASGW